MGAEVLVNAGIHQVRSSWLAAVAWTVDDEQHVCSEPPAYFRIRGYDRHEYADVSPAVLEPLPDWAGTSPSSAFGWVASQAAAATTTWVPPSAACPSRARFTACVPPGTVVRCSSADSWYC
ncbi:hypothetical protein BFF78_36055 [Streptomyces fodineus]|uniref:Uncharacterized protein n=2 Tax=Streptomyces fodineus TaxID=1904616 RepID=A0A1D7YJQ4_9ACTN|nr:hypothetical protein BFF78_36055 [Streptomyces fodineus]